MLPGLFRQAWGMGMRRGALILAAVAYGLWHNGLISLLILVASIPLPWIAVLIANDRPPRSADEPRRYTAAPTRTPLFPTASRPVLEHPIVESEVVTDPPEADGESSDPGKAPHGTGS